jgi:hypothetical protein
MAAKGDGLVVISSLQASKVGYLAQKAWGIDKKQPRA